MPHKVRIPLRAVLNKYTHPDKPQAEELVQHILPLRGNNHWVAGGFVKRLLANESVLEGDIDFFISNSWNLEDNYIGLRQVFINSGCIYTKTHNAITFNLLFPEIKVQIVTSHFDTTLYKTLDRFDFSVCQFGIEDDYIYTYKHALEDLFSKSLRVNPARKDIMKTYRFIKYIKAGYIPRCDLSKRMWTDTMAFPDIWEQTLPVILTDKQKREY